MPVAGLPLWHSNKAGIKDLGLTVALPKAATVGMTVKSPLKFEYGLEALLVEMPPLGRNLLGWQNHPGFYATKRCLDIRLGSVGSLNSVTGEHAIGNARFPGFHCWGAGGELLEHRGFPVLVFNAIACEYDSPLKFTQFVRLLQFTIFLNA